MCLHEAITPVELLLWNPEATDSTYVLAYSQNACKSCLSPTFSWSTLQVECLSSPMTVFLSLFTVSHMCREVCFSPQLERELRLVLITAFVLPRISQSKYRAHTFTSQQDYPLVPAVFFPSVLLWSDNTLITEPLDLTTSTYIFMKRRGSLLVFLPLCLFISLQSIKITTRARSHSSHTPYHLLPPHKER